MKLSIITVVRNNVAEIGETMASVLDAQPGVELEYIVIDGASTDGTVEKILERRSELAYFVSEPDHGIYQAMNKGIRRAAGDVLGVVNAGDRYFPGALKLVADAFADPARLDHTVFWGDAEYSRLGRVRGFRPSNLSRGAFALHPTMFVPRRVYDRVGLYDESFRLLGDYDWMYRAVHRHGVEPLYCPELIAYYREGGISDRHIAACLRDELRVKIRHGAPAGPARILFALKIIKNLPRIVLAKMIK